ncbi:unnamed protein product [Soboliphyme baturini]|uniref:Neur_chan_LBD domain-containing protein n=1 Tax=Soboliphyme baturini TaxID=241478 RepID=A0A183J7P0_9BILA|nr:unnamed protein product [Soboliphyme baturini]
MIALDIRMLCLCIYLLVRDTTSSESSSNGSGSLWSSSPSASSSSPCLQDADVFQIIMRTYNRHQLPQGVRPVLVTIEIDVQDIFMIYDETTDFELSIFLNEEWNDRALDFRHLNSCRDRLVLQGEQTTMLWSPNTCFINSKSSHVHYSPTKNAWAIVFANGTVWTKYRMFLSGPCDMDLFTFPLDHVRCYLTFESFTYNTDEVIMHWRQPIPVQLSQEVWHGQTLQFDPNAPMRPYTPSMYLNEFYLRNINASRVAMVRQCCSVSTHPPSFPNLIPLQ